MELRMRVCMRVRVRVRVRNPLRSSACKERKKNVEKVR